MKNGYRVFSGENISLGTWERDGGGGKSPQLCFIVYLKSCFRSWGVKLFLVLFYSPVETSLALFISTRPNGLNRSAVGGHTCLYIGNQIFLKDGWTGVFYGVFAELRHHFGLLPYSSTIFWSCLIVDTLSKLPT